MTDAITRLQARIYKALDFFFYRKMCPRPDGWLNMTLHGWPYNFTGRIAGFFHKRHCKRCIERYAK